jgi:hypothetical protein
MLFVKPLKILKLQAAGSPAEKTGAFTEITVLNRVLLAFTAEKCEAPAA